jgi:hypothetical protein
MRMSRGRMDSATRGWRLKGRRYPLIDSIAMRNQAGRDVAIARYQRAMGAHTK